MARKTNWDKMFVVGLLISIYMIVIFFIELIAWTLITIPFALINPTFGTVVGLVLIAGIFIANFPILGKVATRVSRRFS